MWRAFRRNCVAKLADLSVAQRHKLLDRSVKPILNFRNSRWPWTQSLADAQSKVQRRMLSYFVNVPRLPSETIESFHRKRMRRVAELQRCYGDWGTEHANRVLDWAEHLRRDRNSASIAAALFKWRDHEWLQSRRQDDSIGTGVGRPGTRAAPGPVPKRWDEALIEARLRARRPYYRHDAMSRSVLRPSPFLAFAARPRRENRMAPFSAVCNPLPVKRGPSFDAA